jgi:hypothetical protein
MRVTLEPLSTKHVIVWSSTGSAIKGARFRESAPGFFNLMGSSSSYCYELQSRYNHDGRAASCKVEIVLPVFGNAYGKQSLDQRYARMPGE